MFSEAVRLANQFTFPFVGLRRRACGNVYSIIGAFVVVNAEGWALTSAHLVDEIVGVERELSGKAPPAEVASQGAITDHAEIWATPGFSERQPRMLEARVRPLADLALIKLADVDSSRMTAFPALRDTAAHPIAQGISVVRVGYPFHNIDAIWDEAAHEFRLPQQAFPVPAFALDGIVARFRRVAGPEPGAAATFIETSTPGLRGQSGGPLLDASGRLCGIQSHTTHLDLGFDARFSAGEQVISERQFLNVGAATHADEVRSLLDEAGVSYQLG